MPSRAPAPQRTDRRPAARPGFRPDIQGLRALAVLAVVLYHAQLPGLEGGLLGVDVFFVISGFLIGGHLLASLRETGRIDLAAFYARRARRILPASAVVLLATAVASAFFVSPVRVGGVLGDAIASALSVPNIRFAVERTDYLSGTEPSPLQHFWSLGVEEQFYAVVPLLLLALWALGRRSMRMLLTTVALLAVASFALGLVLGPSDPWTFFSLGTRAWELAAGLLAAAAAPLAAALPARAAAALGVAGVAGILASFALLSGEGVPHPGLATLAPVLATSVVLWAGAHRAAARAPASVALGVPPLQVLGAISFSLYLVHWPMLVLAQEAVGLDEPLPLSVTLTIAAASFPLAWVLYRLVERPALTHGRIARWRPHRTIAVAGGLVVALVGSLAVAGPALAAIPLDAGRPVAQTALAPDPLGTPFVPSNLTPALRDATQDTGSLYKDGCQQTKSEPELVVCEYGDPSASTVVALFGDSHAGRWFPALQAATAGRDVRIVTLTKSGCRSLETADTWASALNRSCAEWRAAALAWLEATPPDLIVLANHVARTPERLPERVALQWHDAAVTTVARLPAGSRVAVLAPTPQFEVAAPECLSRELDDADACAEPRSEALNSPLAAGERAAAAEAGFDFVDLTDWFCGPAECPPIIGPTLVYTDSHHVSATFSARLGPALGEALGLDRLAR